MAGNVKKFCCKLLAASSSESILKMISICQKVVLRVALPFCHLRCMYMSAVKDDEIQDDEVQDDDVQNISRTAMVSNLFILKSNFCQFIGHVTI